MEETGPKNVADLMRILQQIRPVQLIVPTTPLTRQITQQSIVQQPITRPMIQQPVTRPVTQQHVMRTVLQKPITLPVIQQPTILPIVQQPPITQQPMIFPIIQQPPIMQQPTTLPIIQRSVTRSVIRQPTILSIVQQPVTRPVIQQPTILPIVQQPVTRPIVQQSVTRSVIQQPTILPIIQQFQKPTVIIPTQGITLQPITLPTIQPIQPIQQISTIQPITLPKIQHIQPIQQISIIQPTTLPTIQPIQPIQQQIIQQPITQLQVDPNIIRDINENIQYSPIKIYSPTREISVSDINKQTKLSDIIGVISQQTLTKIESPLLSPHKSPILGPIIIQQSQEDLPVETCCVCLEEEVSQQNLLKCKHAVCGTCLPQFTDPRCPECRLPFNGGVMTKDIIENIQKRKKSGQEEEERIERIRDVMMGRASLILNTQYNVDQFDAAEYTRQSLRDFNPGNFTNVHERLTPVNLVVNDVMDNYGYGINRENLRQSIDSAYTLLESDLFL